MPKINIAKINNIVVPIEDVHYGHGWRYPTDRRIFQSKEKYIEYLKNRRGINHFNFNMKKRLNEIHSITDFDSVINWIEKNGSFLYNCSRNDDNGYDKKTMNFNDWEKIPPNDFSVKIQHLYVKHGKVSNSHSCPVGGITNWGGKDDLPRFYMGWRGRIKFVTSHYLPGHASNYFKIMGIHTGSGGGGRNHYEYDVSFFDDDWSGIASTLTMQYLKNPNAQPFYEHGIGRR